MDGFFDGVRTTGNSAPLISLTYRCNSSAANASGISARSPCTTISATACPSDAMRNVVWSAPSEPIIRLPRIAVSSQINRDFPRCSIYLD